MQLRKAAALNQSSAWLQIFWRYFAVIEKNKIYKKQRLQHEITTVIVLLMPIFRTGKIVLHQGNENMVGHWNYVCTRA